MQFQKKNHLLHTARMPKSMNNTDDGNRRTLRPESPVHLNGFSNVDTHDDPQSLLDYLETTNSDLRARFCKQQLLRILDPKAGDHVLDIGCGLGHMTLELAERVGNTGRVMAIDSSEIMIKEARKRSDNQDGTCIEFRVEDAHRLSFDNSSFDGCIVMSTLIHVTNPIQVLSEILRVLKPGRRIAILEGDWETLVLTTGSQSVERRLTLLLRRSVRNGGVAHQLPTIMKRVGFVEIAVDPGTLTARDFGSANAAWRIRDSVEREKDARALSLAQTRKILQELSRADKAGEFFAAVTGFMVIGKKPSTAHPVPN